MKLPQKVRTKVGIYTWKHSGLLFRNLPLFFTIWRNPEVWDGTVSHTSKKISPVDSCTDFSESIPIPRYRQVNNPRITVDVLWPYQWSGVICETPPYTTVMCCCLFSHWQQRRHRSVPVDRSISVRFVPPDFNGAVIFLPSLKASLHSFPKSMQTAEKIVR